MKSQLPGLEERGQNFAAALEEGIGGTLPPKFNAEESNPEQGIAKLVLTLIELIRRLCEKQALRRTDAGSLSDDEIERLGVTFMRLEKRMEELKSAFGLEGEDLNLNLGPLGDLM